MSPTSSFLLDHLYNNNVSQNTVPHLLYSDISDHMPILILITILNDQESIMTSIDGIQKILLSKIL